MKKCWLDDSNARPTFAELVTLTTDIVKDAKRSVRRKPSDAGSASTSRSNPYENSRKEKQNGSR